MPSPIVGMKAAKLIKKASPISREEKDLFVIAGLGNPGIRYRGTRHNVGFDAIDIISRESGIKVSRLKFMALTGEGLISNERVLLVKPTTYMNLSGESIRDIVEWYKLPLHNLILIYDDADIPLGKIRIRPKGSSGTHKGMQSVIYQLGTDEFPRIRVGIGSPPENWDIADYVLGRFNKDERESVETGITKAVEAAFSIIGLGLEPAMNKYNRAEGGPREE